MSCMLQRCRGGGRSWLPAKVLRQRRVAAGASPKDGVPDMTVISEIDEYGINENLRVRYNRERIYVSQILMLQCIYTVASNIII